MKFKTSSHAFILATVALTLLSSNSVLANSQNKQTEKRVLYGNSLMPGFSKMLQKATDKWFPPQKTNTVKTTVPYRTGVDAAKAMENKGGSIESALDRINQANENKADLGNINSPNANCRDCSNVVTNMRYNSCTDKNNYLESQIVNAKSGSSLLASLINAPLSTKSTIKASCIQMGMSYKFNAQNTSFRTCSGNSYDKRAVRPCLSENYFKMIANSFDVVSSCMTNYISPGDSVSAQKQDVLSVFAMINVESGFHINAVSGTGAGGIGQFTETAISQVNKNDISKVKNMLSASSNPVCKRLAADHLKDSTPMNASSARSCQRITISNGNPLVNMVYTYASLKGVKSDLDRVLFDNKNYGEKFSNLSKEELNKIKRALMIWSHNTGPSGTWTPAKALLNSEYRNKKVTSADEFLKKMEVAMRNFPASSNKASNRRRETSNYFPKISAALKSIEKNVGGGSCLN